MTSIYSYDHTKKQDLYRNLGNMSSYNCIPTSCFSPAAPSADTRSQRDLMDYKKFVTDRNKPTQTEHVKEGFCNCGGGRCGMAQHYYPVEDNGPKMLEQLYLDGTLTENNFPQRKK